jgi:transposase-like protein
VRHDERVERRRQAALGQIARDAADDRPVVGEKKRASEAEEQPAREALEGDADVVADVGAEHDPVAVRGGASYRLRAARIHLLEPRRRARVHDRENQLGAIIDE